MADLSQLLVEVVERRSLVQATLFDPCSTEPAKPFKVIVRPLLLKGSCVYQFESFVGQKTTHCNVSAEEAPREIEKMLSEGFRQAIVYDSSADFHISTAKKGRFSIKTKPASKGVAKLEHDRQKQYIIPEGEPCDFLIRLGVMAKNGDVIAGKHDKFRQMNRFVEMVADVVPHLGTGTIHIVDFGCGKAYLTFALYYFLHVQRGLNVEIVGLDLKSDVIAHCQKIADDLHYDGLKFLVGDVKGFNGFKSVEMVVTLHACDTATDDALAKAVAWNAKVILSVPCCQHELFKKLQSDDLRPMLKHGIVKDRLTALVTDSLRAQLLQALGYSVQMLEFVEVEHTPKNILIRAHRPANREVNAGALEEYKRFRDFWGVSPYIETVLPLPIVST